MKAQGLPLNTIVLGALAVLVLVLLAAVFVPGIGNLIPTLDTGDFVQQCNTKCQGMNLVYSSSTTETFIEGTDFCTMLDADGTTNCPSVISCTISSIDGFSLTIDEAEDCGIGTGGTAPVWT